MSSNGFLKTRNRLFLLTEMKLVCKAKSQISMGLRVLEFIFLNNIFCNILIELLSQKTQCNNCLKLSFSCIFVLSKLMSIVQPTPARVENSKGTDYDKCVTFEIKILTK